MVMTKMMTMTKKNRCWHYPNILHKYNLEQ
jgi:hypothetical protein